MSRHVGLALAALLTAILALADLRSRATTAPAAAPLRVAAPPRPPAAAVKAKKRVRKVLAAASAAPSPPAKVRGARLRDKGEALGGGTPDRVDTGTMTVLAPQ